MPRRIRACSIALALCLAAPAALAQSGGGAPAEAEFALPDLPLDPAPLPTPAPVAPAPAPAPAALDPDAPVAPTAKAAPPERSQEFEALDANAPAPVAAPVADPAPSIDKPAEPAAWSDSDRFWFAPANVRAAPSSGAETGLRRTLTALPGTPGHLRFSLSGDFSQATDFLAPGDANTRLSGTLGIGYVPDPLPFLELFALYRNVSNRNSQNDPSVILTLGDLQVGAKAGWTLPFLADSLSLGLDAAVNPTSGVGDVALDGGATNVEARLLASWDARKLWYFVPVRLHLNAGYASPAGVQVDVDRRTTCVEEYALGANRYHRGLFGAGLEVPLPNVTPFFEAASELPFNPDLTNADGCAFDRGTEPDRTRLLSAGDVMPLSFTLGARITALSQVTFDAGVELGASRYNLWGVRPTAPWSAFAAVSYSFDPVPEPVVREVVKEVVKETVRFEERVVEKKVEVPPAPTTGRIAGAVLDSRTRALVVDVILSVEQFAPAATGASGRFETVELAPGRHRLVAKKQGYEPAALDVDVVAGTATQADLVLVRKIEPSSLVVRVKGANGKAAAGAKVILAGQTPVELVADLNGLARFEGLAPGAARFAVVTATALARGGSVSLTEGKATEFEVALAAAPKKPLAKAGKDALVLARKVAFTGEADLTKADLEVLDAVADLALRAGRGARLRVEASVDLGPVEERNQELSNARAAAVKARLVSLGVAAESIDAVGLGSSAPVVPRAKPKSREKNERVEFRLSN